MNQFLDAVAAELAIRIVEFRHAQEQVDTITAELAIAVRKLNEARRRLVIRELHPYGAR